MRVPRTSLIVVVLLLVNHVQFGHHQRRRAAFRRRPARRNNAGGDDGRAVQRRTRFVGRPGGVECPADCQLRVPDMAAARRAFLDAVDDQDARLVHFTIDLHDHPLPVLETYPYMDNSYGATEWVWASGEHGRRLLALPLDADVLSLYTIDRNRKRIQLRTESAPANCLVALSPECRLYAVRQLLILNATRTDRHRARRDFVCHRVINNTSVGDSSLLLYRCCATTDFRSGEDVNCRTYVGGGGEMIPVLVVIDVLAGLITLFSPLFVLRAKMALRFDASTKFFRASLKHGITGQRNYVIRISSRQLINLGDRRPFSVPRSVFRLVFHGYGEGRCCIHWWADWSHQPNVCRERACCRRFWLGFARALGVLLLYPAILYVAVGLYVPRLPVYLNLIRHTRDSDTYAPISLDVNLVGRSLTPPYNLGVSIWLLYSFCAFMYSMVVLSSPNNPLERCLLRYEGKRPHEQPAILYGRMTRGYKAVLHRLAYGEFTTKRHFFRVPWLPWGVRRTAKFIVRVLSQIPVVHVCFTTFMFDAKIFDAESVEQRRRREAAAADFDEAADKAPSLSAPSARQAGRWCVVTVVWIGFAMMLAGYCTAVFVMAEFCLNVAMFVAVAGALNAAELLPWLSGAAVIAFYVNDILSTINSEHRYVLRLIDENSPRISAVEDGNEATTFATGIPTLRAHNLGAVKFIDSDSTEYVSKELYHNVCADLKCGWSSTVRRLVRRIVVISAYVAFLFTTLSTINDLVCGSELLVVVVAVVGSAAPKLLEAYAEARGLRPDRRAAWARVIPDVLDRHIRVDRTRCIDETEEPLTTYDVRPIGVVELEAPRPGSFRTLSLWKFPWIVSGDQQTPSHDPMIVAFANKLAASSFLSRAVTRALPSPSDPASLRQWCLVVEGCILEAATAASSVDGTPLDSVPLFSRDVLPLVAAFDAGNTIDSVVDCVNRELYAPYARGSLVTIANASLAVYKVDAQIVAFSAAGHGDQVTDLFGAVLVVADFNTQNLQLAIKYLIDPYRPDAVPVYSAVPVEGYVFRSPEILEIESVV